MSTSNPLEITKDQENQNTRVIIIQRLEQIKAGKKNFIAGVKRFRTFVEENAEALGAEGVAAINTEIDTLLS